MTAGRYADRLKRLSWGTFTLASVLAVGVWQNQPRVVVDVRTTNGRPTAYVSLRDLLSDRRFLPALQSGFPLYVVYTLELRRSRSGWFDRTVDHQSWEYVVIHNPVRDTYVVEEEGRRSELPNDEELRLVLARVFAGHLDPNEPGRHYYKAIVAARTLSDADIDEVFDWLRGEDADSLADHDRGLLTRTARRLLVSVAPLPQISLSAQSEPFTWP